MNIIHFSTVFSRLDNYVKVYNSNQDHLSTHLRQPVIATAREIIKIYSLSLIKANNIRELDLDDIPCLATNNVQLAKKANVSTRTIQRHLKRLLNANVLTQKVFRGSNASYHLKFNPEILLISGKKPVKKEEKSIPKQNLKSTDNQFFKKYTVSTCPHTDSSNNSYINNLIISVDNKLDSEKERCSHSLTDNNCTGNVTRNNGARYTEEEGVKNFNEPLSQGKLGARENFQKNSQNIKIERQNQDAEEEGKSQEVARQAKTSGVWQNTSGFSDSNLNVYVDSLWNLAKNMLYNDIFLTKNQEKRAKELLYLWYEPVKKRHLNRVHNVYVERIELVRKYIARDRENRYVQLPNKYFDPTNKYGFTGTKIWYENQVKSKQRTRLKLILHAQIRRFLNNEKKDTSLQVPRLQLFRQCEARIGKLKDQELLNQFYASILDKTSFNFFQFNTQLRC